MSRNDSKDLLDHPSVVIGLIVGILVLLGYLGHELIIHTKDILANGVAPCISVFWKGALAFTAFLTVGIGATAASTVVISCVVIPVTSVTIYTIFRKNEEKSKALIVALSLFLDPLFIDFFKEEIGKDDVIKKFLVDATGVVTFLAACYFWSLATREAEPKGKPSKLSRLFLPGTAILLFLTPTLAILGYVAREAAGDWTKFIHEFTPEKIIGLSGLVLVATIGIILSRYFEGP
jgi:hypothetical protein